SSHLAPTALPPFPYTTLFRSYATRQRFTSREKAGTRRGSVTAAGAAAAHLRPLGQLLALFHLEGVATATGRDGVRVLDLEPGLLDRKSTRLNSSHSPISYALF